MMNQFLRIMNFFFPDGLIGLGSRLSDAWALKPPGGKNSLAKPPRSSPLPGAEPLKWVHWRRNDWPLDQ